MIVHAFTAPWSIRLTLITSFIALLLGTLYTLLPGWPRLLIAGIAIGTALFCVLGYDVGGGRLRIRRLGWSTIYDLGALQSVAIVPNAMDRSVRLFGIGGLFGYIGRFRNADLGTFSAFATNEEGTVVLQFVDETVVVTPSNPEVFAAAVAAEMPGPAETDA